MEKLIQTLITHHKKSNKLVKKQNRLLKKMLANTRPSGKEYLQNNLLDNTDIKQIFKIADTKFYELKKILEAYRPLGKDYYFADEVVEAIKKHRTPPKSNPPS